MIANNQKVIISTLTQGSASRLKEKYSIGNSVIVSPMAAPREFFSKSVTNASKVVTVGYLGKFTSSGRSNGIENLIKELKIAADSMPNLRFLFIGIEREYRQVIESLVDSSQLKEKLNLIDHVEGDELFDALKEINIGLVPYPEDVYHANRFPIKIVEYAALRATILATDTKAHREILGDDLGYFYDSTIKGSLARRLKEMLIEPELMNEKRTNARTWAETHTYLSRVQIVIHELEERFRVS
jgi:glycosyltransferase involved in cell wall biosynthesis